MGYAVSLKPHVSEAELHQAYRESSFTVFPSLLEGFGLPIIESLWHGRPVVCGGKGALGEVAAGGGSERVEPASIRDLARGIRLLLTDEAHYKTRYQEIQKRLFRSWNDYWQDVSGVIQTLDKN
jgi:glycosyltransferase involved in cell wall biosynthesis